MGGKSKAPPPPDYSGVANASRESAELSYKLGQEQLSWAREQYAKDSAITQRVTDSFLQYQEEASANARKDRARYEQVFQPLEDDLVEDAAGYTDERNRARAEAAAGRAAADVSQQYALARTSAQDRLESFGIDPSQVRAGALDVQARIAEATARAGASNVMREQKLMQEEATGNALRTEALNIGKGYPGQVAGAYQTALASGAGTTNATLAQTASGANTMGTGMQWQGLGNSALGTWGNTLNMGHQNAMAAYNANQKQSSGWGSALGMVAGMGMSAINPTSMFGRMMAAEGGTVPEIDTTQGPHAGVMIDENMSPSKGVEVDDVPARLNANEFVIPADVLKWKGEEFFQRTIESARKKKQEAPAKPTVMVGVPATPPGNPAAQALPVG
jgi:hypothetical protein